MFFFPRAINAPFGAVTRAVVDGGLGAMFLTSVIIVEINFGAFLGALVGTAVLRQNSTQRTNQIALVEYLEHQLVVALMQVLELSKQVLVH